MQQCQHTAANSENKEKALLLLSERDQQKLRTAQRWHPGPEESCWQTASSKIGRAGITLCNQGGNRGMPNVEHYTQHWWRLSISNDTESPIASSKAGEHLCIVDSLFRGFGKWRSGPWRHHSQAGESFSSNVGSGKLEDTGRPVAFVHGIFTLKPTLVNHYMNIVRFLHLECGLSHPSKDLWMATSTLQGTDIVKVCEVVRKTPISLADLLSTRGKLNPSVQKDAIFGAVGLIMFFCL